MVEGLTFFSTDQGSHAGGLGSPGRDCARKNNSKSKPSIAGARADQFQVCRVVAAETTIQTHEILVTLAERPHPFPSRTRKLSSPAPKILRGQPFGKIGRRQDFCVSGPLAPSPTAKVRAGPAPHPPPGEGVKCPQASLPLPFSWGGGEGRRGGGGGFPILGPPSRGGERGGCLRRVSSGHDCACRRSRPGPATPAWHVPSRGTIPTADLRPGRPRRCAARSVDVPNPTGCPFQCIGRRDGCLPVPRRHGNHVGRRRSGGRTSLRRGRPTGAPRPGEADPPLPDDRSPRLPAVRGRGRADRPSDGDGSGRFPGRRPVRSPRQRAR